MTKQESPANAKVSARQPWYCTHILLQKYVVEQHILIEFPRPTVARRPLSGGTRQNFWIKLISQKLKGLGYSVVKVAWSCFLRVMLAQSAVMRLHVVCLSVRLSLRLSVTIRYRVQIRWNSSKIISLPNSLRPMCLLTPNLGDLVQREHPQN